MRTWCEVRNFASQKFCLTPVISFLRLYKTGYSQYFSKICWRVKIWSAAVRPGRKRHWLSSSVSSRHLFIWHFTDTFPHFEDVWSPVLYMKHSYYLRMRLNAPDGELLVWTKIDKFAENAPQSGGAGSKLYSLDLDQTAATRGHKTIL